MKGSLLGEGHGLDPLSGFIVRPIAQDSMPRVRIADGHYFKALVEYIVGQDIAPPNESGCIFPQTGNEKISQ
jgi:hypothetical protein